MSLSRFSLGRPDIDPVDFSKLPCPISFHDLPSAFKNNFFEDPKVLWGHSLFCSWENWLFQQLTSNNSVVNGLWQLSFLFEGTYIHTCTSEHAGHTGTYSSPSLASCSGKDINLCASLIEGKDGKPSNILPSRVIYLDVILLAIKKMVNISLSELFPKESTCTLNSNSKLSLSWYPSLFIPARKKMKDTRTGEMAQSLRVKKGGLAEDPGSFYNTPLPLIATCHSCCREFGTSSVLYGCCSQTCCVDRHACKTLIHFF